MREAEDALRSVRRAVQSALGSPPWRVMLVADPGRTTRPYAIVSDATGTTQAREMPDTDTMGMPLVVYCYPEPGGRPSESKLAAHRALIALEWMLRGGAVDHADATVRGYQRLIPLWDYVGPDGQWLPLDGPDSAARYAEDYLAVDDGWSVLVRPDADEGQSFAAVLQMRVQWSRATGSPAAGVPLVSARVQFP